MGRLTRRFSIPALQAGLRCCCLQKNGAALERSDLPSPGLSLAGNVADPSHAFVQGSILRQGYGRQASAATHFAETVLVLS